ncbi:DNA starvation/stationary phase protection protein [Neobacillus sp. DY30]|uniref:Dps family protein n=1 Tax=Neobacillus sp. DY30 TaxID=3047871 RepID=UPI0024BF9916|nr:DNA starvation/stationary phase protection protein [Neobacillus sp. DY30]WHY00521.1 DNA starvation/stationary phase protection protein [Neobacillus sp. DY30]
MATSTKTKSKSKEKSLTLSEALNRQVANFSVLHMKLHHFHWYVKGENFFTLHLKFEELYKEAALHLDTIAERMLAQGALPVATLEEILDLTTLKEAKGDENAKQMVQTLADDFDMICTELTEGISLAEENEDQPTEDLLVHIRTSLEKHRWMFEAYLAD